MKWLVPLSAVVALFLGCGPVSEHRVRVGIIPHQAPLAWVDRDGKIVGFEVELVRALAQNKGWDLEWVPLETPGFFLGGFPGETLQRLNRGDFDVVISGVVSSLDLASQFGASEGYLRAGPILVVNSKSSVKGLSEWSFAASGTLGVLAGSTAVQAVARSPGARDSVRMYFDLEAALDDVADGRLDGVVADTLAVAQARAQNEKLRLMTRTAGEPLTEETAGFVSVQASEHSYVAVVSKAREALLDQINQGLEALKADGTLEALKRRYLLP